MSSRHDSTGYNSLNDSIPLETSGEEGEYDDDEAGSTLLADESYTQSAYTGTTLRDRSERSSSYHTRDIARSPSRTTGSLAAATTSNVASVARDSRGRAEYTATTSYLAPTDANSDSYFYNSNTEYEENDDGEDYEYSSTGYYGSMSYDDSSLRSPRSSSVMSSTLASLYYESPFVQRAWDTLNFLRRPLFFLAFVTGGGSVVSGIGRLAESMQRSVTPSLNAALSASLPTVQASASSPLMQHHVAQLPHGYPSVPDWLREVRAALPASVERPVRWCLRHKGVPILSELQEQQWKEMTNKTTATINSQAASSTGAFALPNTNDAANVTASAGMQKMIPAAVFLPAFSYGVLIACKYILARQNNANAFLYAQQRDEEEAEEMTGERTGVAADESEGLSAVDATTRESTVVRDSLMLDEDDTAEQPERRLTVLQSTSPERAALLPSDKDRSRAEEDVVVHAVQDGAELLGGSDAQLSAIAPANTTLPSTIVLDTSAAREDDQEEVGSSNAVTRDTAAVRSVRSTASLPSTVVAEPPAALPSSSQLLSRRPTRSPMSEVIPGPSNEVQRETSRATIRSRADEAGVAMTTNNRASANSSMTSLNQSSSNSRFRGTVVAALVGDAATALEVNALLLAAAKYGCRAVLLPQSTAQLPGLLPTPPSLTVQHASNVLRAVEQLTQRSALRCIGVFAPSVAAAVVADDDVDVVDLPQMTHPAEALYLFVAAANAHTVAARVAAVAQTRVRTRKTPSPSATSRSAEDMSTVVNECFYDRLAKERQERLAELAVNRSSYRERESEIRR